MSARWWAPGTDLDARVLLTPVGDAKVDLGAALLALHRAGAEACEDAARTPLLDERMLVDALAKARQLVAPPVVDVIAKCVEGPAYAGLLVRDIANDADTSALELYRAAVAKGVPRPIAAQRAGAIYGVTAKGLGEYRRLACDPRANPAAITDAADRALFGHLSKIVEAEAEQPYEQVSKAPAATATRTAVAEDNPTTRYWDARDAAGRFAPAGTQTPAAPATPTVGQNRMAALRERLGLSGGPQVAGGEPTTEVAEPVQAPVEAPPKPVADRAAAKDRQRKAADAARRARRARARRRSATTEAGPAAARRGAERREVKRSAVALRQAARREAQLAARTKKAMAAGRIEYLPDDLLEPVKGMQVTVVNPKQMVAVLPDEKIRALILKQGGDLKDGVYLRAKHLTHLMASEASDYSGEADKPSSGHQELLEQAMGYHGLDPKHQVDAHVYKAEEFGHYYSPLEAMDEFASDLNGDEPEFQDRWEGMGLYGSPDDIAVVDTLAEHEGSPAIYDVIIRDARGAPEGSGNHQQFVIDPNQAFRITLPQLPVASWDTKNNVRRFTVIAEPITEDEAKAVRQRRGFAKAATATAWDYRQEQLHPRNADGRWTTTLARPTMVAPTAAPTRLDALRTKINAAAATPPQAADPVPAADRRSRTQRQALAARRARRARTTRHAPQATPTPAARATAQRAGAAQASAQRMPLSRREVARAVAAQREKLPKALLFPTDSSYAIAPAGIMRTMLGQSSRRWPPQTVRLHSAMRDAITTSQIRDGGDEFEQEIVDRFHAEMTAKQGKAPMEYVSGLRATNDFDGQIKVFQEMLRIAKEYPDAVMLHAERIAANDSHASWRILRETARPEVIVTVDDDRHETDLGSPYDLEFVFEHELIGMPSLPQQIQQQALMLYRVPVLHYRAVNG